MLRKQKRIVAAAVLLLLIVIVMLYSCAKNLQTRDGASEADIAAFLASYGWEVGIKAVNIDEVSIPVEFGEVYEQYNEIQLKNGYDLSEYRGETVTKYTFTVTNFDVGGDTSLNAEAHVLVFDGRIIGGDVCSTDLGGFMCGFEK